MAVTSRERDYRNPARYTAAPNRCPPAGRTALPHMPNRSTPVRISWEPMRRRNRRTYRPERQYERRLACGLLWAALALLCISWLLYGSF